MLVDLNRNNVSFGYEEAVEELQIEIEKINKIIKNYKELNNKEKYELLEFLYRLLIEEKDLIDFINIKYNRNYNKTITLKTKMEDEFIAQEGHGRDFSWWTEKYRVLVNCAYNDKNNIEHKKYSYDEIKELIDNNTIYPIGVQIESIHEYSKDREEVKRIKTLIENDILLSREDYYIEGYDFKVSDEDLDIIMQILEKKLKYNNILKDTKQYLKELIEELKDSEWRCSPAEIEMLPKLQKIYKHSFKK